MRILLLSPYDARSHQYWREGLVDAFAEHTFEVVTLPARHFSWRFRGNSLTLAFDSRLKSRFDLVIATSMTDLAALRGMLPALAPVPTVVYFHENQFDYPGDSPRIHQVERQITSIYTALAANRVVFNSAYNRSTFLTGAESLLARMPDQVPAGIVSHLTSGSRVLPVPLRDENRVVQARGPLPTILWNHRWEHDKGPEVLLAILEALLAQTTRFRFHLVGQQFRQVPEALSRCLALLDGAGIDGQRGYQPRTEYLALLGESDVVLSTAHHEFQGLAVLEAVAAGAMPVVPARLAYPEYFDQAFLYDSPGAAVAMLRDALLMHSRGEPLTVPNVSHLRWSVQRPAWVDVINF